MPATSSAMDNSEGRERFQGKYVFPRQVRKRKRQLRQGTAQRPARRQAAARWGMVARRLPVAATPGDGGGSVGVVVPNRVPSDRGAELIERAQALALLIAGAAEQIEAKREIPEPVLAALH